MKIKNLLSIVLVLAAFVFAFMPSFAVEENMIVGVDIVNDSLMIFTNFNPTSVNSVQIANAECDVSYYGSIADADLAAETLVMIDVSGSIGASNHEDIYTILSDLIENKFSGDSISIMTFGTEIDVLVDFTVDRFDLLKSIENIEYTANLTYLYSSIAEAVDIVEERQTDSFKRILLITDGHENSVTGITLSELQKKLEESGIPIYTIGVGESTQSLKTLASFSRVTNAMYNEITDYKEVYNSINNYVNYGIVIAEIPREHMDGGIKRLRLSAETQSGATELYRDIRFPMGDATAASTPQNENDNAELSPPQIEQPATAPADPATPSDNSGNIILYLILGVLAVVVIVIIILVLTSRNKKTEHVQPVVEVIPIKTPEIKLVPEATEFLVEENSSSGDTLLLFKTSAEPEIIIKLTDENNRTNSFQTAVGQGVVIGRSAEDCMITITYDKSIGRRHCRIFQEAGLLYAEDLNSANGTHLNNIKINGKTQIRSGDILKLGRVVMRFEVL